MDHNKRWYLTRKLEKYNPHTLGIWGSGGVFCLVGREIFPVPFTNNTLWVRRGYRRIFHISNFDLVD